MSEKIIFKQSVRGIIEYCLKSGSIDDRYTSRARAVDGIVAHGKLQKDNDNKYENYEKEVTLKIEFEREHILVRVEGRADGIIKKKNLIIIEEIKSTYKDLIYIEENYNELHWAQSKFYGYIYCKDNNLDSIDIRLSYYNINTDEVKSFQKQYSLLELEKFVDKIMNKFFEIIELQQKARIERDNSIQQLDFPFEKYRKGQRELAINCFNCIKEQSMMFIQAPTGIGKTISTIFPAIKSLGINRGQRIIYLTAKTITSTVAEETIKKLISKGLVVKAVLITAKEKMCLNNEVKCNPDDCIYAKDYYSKIDNVIKDTMMNTSIFSRDKIKWYGEQYKVCPFELSLDLTYYCDVIICDYNYAFDPRVRLKRLFEETSKENIVLIDEAHNLVNRARGMYSGEITKNKVLLITRLIKGKAPSIYKIANQINKEMISIRRELEEENLNITNKNVVYKDLIKLLRIYISEADNFLVKNKGIVGYDEILDFYFDAKTFISLSELYSDEYTTILTREKSELTIKIFCIDPSKNIGKVLNEAYSAIIFSATLSPIKYYIDLLGGNENSYRFSLTSPFNKENLSTYIYDLDMRYVNRDKNIDELSTVINKFIKEERGNYIVFCPSFEYMRKVYNAYIERYSEENIIIQNENLSELEKEDFLNSFYVGANIVAFCVIGGMFSEGVDLIGERLIGTIVVGVGFPKVSIENNIISDYFLEKGFDYAYTYPGINKVLQSVGRIIRTEEDKGRALLVDNRYNYNKYRSMLPKEWNIKKYK